jgi:hypothetical protein
MSWVLEEWNGEEYQGRRSAFWRVARDTITSLRKEREQTETWPSHLVWSNLYKVAPECGGNPGILMRNAQEDWCVEMLAMEMEAYKPQNVLFMTGYADWAKPFLERLGFTPAAAEPLGFLEASGQLKISTTQTCRIAVVPHPQGKPEREIVKQAVSAFTR